MQRLLTSIISGVVHLYSGTAKGGRPLERASSTVPPKPSKSLRQKEDRSLLASPYADGNIPSVNIPHLGSALIKVLIPSLAIAAVILAHRVRKLSLEEHVGLRKPPVGAAVCWLLVYIAVMLGSNYFMNWRGPWDFSAWRNAPLAVDILRVVAVGVLGPIAEELIFRGVLYGRLARSRLGVPGAIVVSALVWGMIHYTYTPGVIALLVFDGLLLGTARWQTRSVITPILMHVVWNLYAVW